jgi:hypothetical protein
MSLDYNKLAIAIMWQAANDYRAARWRYENYIGVGKEIAAAELEDLERFFKSKRAYIYSFGQAENILERLKSEPIPKKLKKIKRENIQ